MRVGCCYMGACETVYVRTCVFVGRVFVREPVVLVCGKRGNSPSRPLCSHRRVRVSVCAAMEDPVPPTLPFLNSESVGRLARTYLAVAVRLKIERHGALAKEIARLDVDAGKLETLVRGVPLAFRLPARAVLCVFRAQRVRGRESATRVGWPAPAVGPTLGRFDAGVAPLLALLRRAATPLARARV